MIVPGLLLVREVHELFEYRKAMAWSPLEPINWIGLFTPLTAFFMVTLLGVTVSFVLRHAAISRTHQRNVDFQL